MGLKDNYSTVAQAAEDLNVTRQTIYRWIKNGILKAEKMGRETLIEKAEVFRYKDQKVGDWLYEGFNISLKKDNYRPIREHFGYAEGDKIDRMGDPKTLVYMVTRENGRKEIVIIKSIHVSLNKKTGHLMSEVDPEDIIRKPSRKKPKRKAQATSGDVV